MVFHVILCLMKLKASSSLCINQLLSCGPAFYKRKLWMYNFCLHDIGTDMASMFLWPETAAGRGSSAIASCLVQYLKATKVQAKNLIVFSDNCSGQNTNFNITALCSYLIAAGDFEEILHIFPISGHTMMPSDRDFEDIERKLRKKKCIYGPSEYVEIMIILNYSMVNININMLVFVV